MADLKELAQTEPWDWPPDAGRRLLEALTDRRATLADRLQAGKFAGELVVMNDELASALLALAGNGDEPDELRARAAVSLGPVLDQMAVELDAPEPDLPISGTTFENLKERLRQIFSDPAVPKEVRRRVLEGSVRAPEAWHEAATREAYASSDPEWRLTAVFCMRFVRGFDREIVEALDANDSDIHYEAVVAAGYRAVEEAWPHVKALLTRPPADKALLLAAIESSATIRPDEVPELLADFLVSDEEDVAAAAEEAVAMAEGLTDHDEDDDDEDEDEDDEDEDDAWGTDGDRGTDGDEDDEDEDDDDEVR